MMSENASDARAVRPQVQTPPSDLPPGLGPSTPNFGDQVTSNKKSRLEHASSIRLGFFLVGFFVLGAIVWASFAKIASATVAPAFFAVEANRKTLRAPSAAMIRNILVREGDAVTEGQVVMRFDQTTSQAQIEILRSQADSALMQAARLRAEITGSDLIIPQEIAVRLDDPSVSVVVATEKALFEVRRAALTSQEGILRQREMQLSAARSGLNLQLQSLRSQRALALEELGGFRQVFAQGFGSRAVVIRAERQLADIDGRIGAISAELQRNEEQAGEARLQLSNLRESRASEAAAMLRDAEARLADIAPRLEAAHVALAETEIRAPVSGIVFNLRQFTEGALAPAGEVLMDIVPRGVPLVLQARIDPRDIDRVRPGLTADVTLSAFSPSVTPKLKATVRTVSADAVVDSEAGSAYFMAELEVSLAELQRLPGNAVVLPGMQAQVMIIAGERTVMDYLLSPFTAAISSSLREE